VGHFAQNTGGAVQLPGGLDDQIRFAGLSRTHSPCRGDHFRGVRHLETPTDTDLETRKLRIADAVLVGLLALFIFTAILHFVDGEGAGEEIFNKASPVIFALVGTIVGYIFGTRTKQ
jgi:hypothetical protein